MKTNTQNQKKSGLKNRSEQLSTPNTGTESGKTIGKTDSRLPIDHAKRRENRCLPTEQLSEQLETALPEAFAFAEIVGEWVWVQLQEIPAAEIRQQLAQLGFHWNNARLSWQHPCGTLREESSTYDPRKKYGSRLAKAA